MADQDIKAEDNVEVPQETDQEPEQVEEQVSEAVEQPEEVETQEEPQEEPKEETPTEEEAPSRREQLRIQQLLKKYPETYGKAPKQQDALDYESALNADPEVVAQLEKDRQIVSDRAYQQGIQQSLTREWKRDLKYDAPLVEKEYPFLNPNDKDNFNPVVAEAMNQKYLRFVGYNEGDPQKGIPESVQLPDVSYKEFMDSEMELVNELANRKASESTKNVTKQAALTGLRPDGSSAKRLNLNKAPQDMTDEELEAVTGYKLGVKSK